MRDVLTIVFALMLMQCKDREMPSGLSSSDALKSFAIADGFEIELVASEPMISDPVAMDVDANGNIYVAEMHGYPLDTRGSGVIKRLTDSDGDGFPDKSIVFAEELILPMGVMCWKRGIIVVDSPNVIYLEDTNDDGKADVKQVVLTGFALSNPQHNANTPIFGLDNWIYLAHQGEVTPIVYVNEFGDVGSAIRFPEDDSAPTLPSNANGRSIRFRPETKQIEMLSGDSQYGHTFDSWGHLLGTSNADHLFQEVIAARYLIRNPNLKLASTIQMLSDHGDACEVFPTTLNPEHQLLTDIGVITSSCGVTWYTGGLFPAAFSNYTFIAEPVHNLVHIDHITDQGATFNASRVYERAEFLTSTDAWFRPVNFYIGPDGALYIIDYYRQIIEHPEWMSDEVAASGELYNGSNLGRIYRVTPSATPPLDWCGKINLNDLPTVELARYLASNNSWWRRTAQRLIIERQDRSCLSAIKNLIDTTSAAPGIVHALWTLEGLGATDPEYVKKALKHPTAGVRENAIKIAELHLDYGFENNLLLLQNDTNAKVRFQLLCTLGLMDNEQANKARVEILSKDIEDEWVHIAALTSAAGNEMELLIANCSQRETAGRKSFLSRCATVVGLSNRKPDVDLLISMASKNLSQTESWWQAALLSGLARAAREVRIPANELAATLKGEFDKSARPEIRQAKVNLLVITNIPDTELKKTLLDVARSVAFDSSLDVSMRIDALNLLTLESEVDASLYEDLINPSTPQALQATAVVVYSKLDKAGAANLFVSRWKSLTPLVRDRAMAAFLSSPLSANILLNAIEGKQIQPSTISWPGKVTLMNNYDEGIRKKARALLSGSDDNREKVIDEYQLALSLDGNAASGKEVFQRVCSTCHQINGKDGKTFGPDLATIRNRDKSFIVQDILDPDRSIADGFEIWNIGRTDGEVLTGVISGETSLTITIRTVDGEESTVRREEIKTIEALDSSGMPRGLESTISVNDLADLIAYIKGI